jgi:small subunit ribosomal protein S13
MADKKDAGTDKKDSGKQDKQEKKPVHKPMDNKPEVRYLVRVSNTDLDGRKDILISIQKIRGIGDMYANAICHAAGINKRKNTGELSEAEVKAIEDVLQNPAKHHIPEWLFNRRSDPETGDNRHLITTDLMFSKDMDIKLMKKTKSYKGMRHQWGLPVRGQRTKSNFRRNKGKGLGVQKKKTPPAKGK